MNHRLRNALPGDCAVFSQLPDGGQSDEARIDLEEFSQPFPIVAATLRRPACSGRT